MPWKVADVDDHVKGLSDKQKNVWVRVANGALMACEEAGKSDCEGSAIRQANAVAGGMREAGCVIGEDGAVSFEEPLRESDEKPGPILRAIEGLSKLLTKRQNEAAAELCSDLTPLIESSVRPDGTMPIKIIAPGWGNSGYYSSELLERDGPKVYKRGLHMYLNHPTVTEKHERPERSVADLVGTLASDGRWQKNGSAGPGIYADAQVAEAFRGSLGELAPHIGLSHRAVGEATEGEAEGKRGPIVQNMVKVESVDFVTKAAAGGKVLELMESARGRLLKQKEDENMPTEQELKEAVDGRAAAEKERDELKEARTTQATELARLQEGAVLREAREIATEVLGKVEHLPELTRARLVESLSKSPPTKDGALDRDAYEKAIEEAAKAEIDYLAKLTESGSIKGMGSAAGGDDEEKVDAELEESFRRLGATESGAKIAVAGRN
jgi:hypothetical protein